MHARARKTFMTLAIVLGASCLASADEAGKKPEFGRLSLDEVAARLGDKSVFLFDNNARVRWAKGHVPGARWVDYARVTADVLPKDKDATLIVYCANTH